LKEVIGFPFHCETHGTEYIDLAVGSHISAKIYEVVMIVPKRLTGSLLIVPGVA